MQEKYSTGNKRRHLKKNTASSFSVNDNVNEALRKFLKIYFMGGVS